jgi:PKD repeat protein/type 1 glutamine amidotransferase
MRRFGGLMCLGLAASAFAGAAAAHAAPARDVVASASRTSKLLSLSSPPQVAAPGSVFRMRGRVANRSSRQARIRLTVTLRKTKTSRKLGRIGAKRLAPLRAGRTRRYKVRVRLPGGLAAGRYVLRACARIPGKGFHCRFRRITVSGAPGTPPPAPPGQSPGGPQTPPGEQERRYRVLAFTETSGEYAGAIPAAVAALEAAGREHRFHVDVANESSVFNDRTLARYRAVVFVNVVGDVLTDDEQAAFERYHGDGGSFVGIHAAIGAEPGWSFMTDVLGTRASGAAAEASNAIIKVADRVHDASKTLPEYWRHGAEKYFNYEQNVRGVSHVMATVVEKTYSGGTMGADHPVAWCKDYRGGRSFYTGVGASAQSYQDGEVREHLGGAIEWAAGQSDPAYSDCGATVLANYEQTKLSAPPNLNEPIGFDRLPDGRIIQTARAGQVRLHEPGGAEVILLNGGCPSACELPVYTNSEDGMYGPAVDNDFASNRWVYLFYAPATVTGVKQSDGSTATITTPPGSAPNTAAALSAWDQWAGYFQLSRFKFVERAGSTPPRLDVASEQKIMQVANNRGACCHVGGDIDFDKHNNLWLVTGDDTPAGGGNSGGFSPHNDQKTDETQTVRVNGATGGTFSLTFSGQTTTPIPFNATGAQVQSALDALSNVNPGDAVVNCAAATPCNATQTVNSTTMTVVFDGQYAQQDVPQMTADGSGLTGTSPSVAIATTLQANLFNAPHVDARRSALNTNDLRGKVLRIKVNEDGSYTSPSGNLFAPGVAGTRPEIYAMGFRNPFRIQVDENDVAYVTDYSPDSQVPEQFRGPAGTGRVEVVRKPSSYGWPLCYAPDLPYYRWNFNTTRPLDNPPRPHECGNPARGPQNNSRWNLTGGPTVEPGLEFGPRITHPDIWYSYRDNQNPPLGTPCFASYGPTLGSCPQLFPELFTGGVGPHGAAPYDYDPGNPSPTKFPPYYDGSFVFGEFTQDSMREVRVDSEGRVFKINQFMNCGQALIRTAFPFECDNPMDMQFGSDGNFYLLTYGDGFFAANADAGMYKWEYRKGQRAPQAVLNATPTNGQAPLTVQFSSEGSRDPDPGDSIEFAWDFDGNGTVDSIDPNPRHTYTTNGVYTARLTVTDSSGKTDTKSTVITVGNTAPTVTINTPADGDFFAFGQNIPYTVTVTDPEDGPIDCNRVEVTFVLVHDTHGHAEANQNGCSGVLPTDAADASHGGYLAGGINASYTDTGANGQPPLTTNAQNLLQVRRQEVEFAQEESGTGIGNVGMNDAGGGQNRNSLDPGDWIALNNRFNLANMDKTITFRFGGGSAANPAGQPRAAVEIRQDSVDGPIVTTATLNSTSSVNNNTYTSQTFPLPLTGTHRLFLVFRAVPGGPATGFGNLNWVEFSGAGAGVNP